MPPGPRLAPIAVDQRSPNVGQALGPLIARFPYFPRPDRCIRSRGWARRAYMVSVLVCSSRATAVCGAALGRLRLHGVGALEQAPLGRNASRLQARVGAELGEHVGDVTAGGALGDHKPLGDGPV